MLRLGEQEFTQGRSKFLDAPPDKPEPSAKIFIKIQFKGLGAWQLAQLDTGAAWSVLDPSTASTIEAAIGMPPKFGTARMSTRLGTREGTLVRLPFTFLADEGESLDFDCTFFVPEEWPVGQIFLGYTSLLDSIRLALDPVANNFYFGLSG